MRGNIKEGCLLWDRCVRFFPSNTALTLKPHIFSAFINPDFPVWLSSFFSFSLNKSLEQREREREATFDSLQSAKYICSKHVSKYSSERWESYTWADTESCMHTQVAKCNFCICSCTHLLAWPDTQRCQCQVVAQYADLFFFFSSLSERMQDPSHASEMAKIKCTTAAGNICDTSYKLHIGTCIVSFPLRETCWYKKRPHESSSDLL